MSKNMDGVRKENFAYRVENFAVAELDKNSKRIPTNIFHYTSTYGLERILKSKQLFATDVRYMNDTSELEYGVEVVCDNLKQEKNKNTGEFGDVLDMLSDSFSDHHKFYTSIGAYYAVCFCKNGNLLSQWRSYGADGQGYALGFNARKLMKLSSVINQKMVLREMIYSVDIQKDLISNLLNFSRSVLDDMEADSLLEKKEDLKLEMTLALRDSLHRIVPWFKHSGFQEENEWRLVCWKSNPLMVRNEPPEKYPPNTRLRGNTLIPYSTVELSPEKDGSDFPIDKIICGPSTSKEFSLEKNQYALELAILNYCPKKIEILPSAIPYMSASK